MRILWTADLWNELYPVGQAVRYYPLAGEADYRTAVTRSPAWALGHGEVVVKLSGIAGGVSVRHLAIIVERMADIDAARVEVT